MIGWQRVHTYLGDGPACHVHRAAGWETCPLLHVFDTCADLIRTLPDLPHDMTHVEDVDTDAEDHAADALRYLLMSLPEPQRPLHKDQPPRTQEERAQAYLERRLSSPRNKGRQIGA